MGKCAEESCRGLQIGSEWRSWTKQVYLALVPDIKPMKWEKKGRQFSLFVTSIKSILQSFRGIFLLLHRITNMQGDRAIFPKKKWL